MWYTSGEVGEDTHPGNTAAKNRGQRERQDGWNMAESSSRVVELKNIQSLQKNRKGPQISKRHKKKMKEAGQWKNNVEVNEHFGKEKGGGNPWQKTLFGAAQILWMSKLHYWVIPNNLEKKNTRKSRRESCHLCTWKWFFAITTTALGEFFPNSALCVCSIQTHFNVISSKNLQ